MTVPTEQAATDAGSTSTKQGFLCKVGLRGQSGYNLTVNYTLLVMSTVMMVLDIGWDLGMSHPGSMLTFKLTGAVSMMIVAWTRAIEAHHVLRTTKDVRHACVLLAISAFCGIIYILFLISAVHQLEYLQ